MTPTPTPGTPTPAAVPDLVRGKIAFLSDRTGGPGPVVLIMDPDGSNVRMPSEQSFYRRALDDDMFSPDRVHHLFVRLSQATGKRVISGASIDVTVSNAEIWVQNQPDGWEWNLITGPRIAYDPVWSPDGVHIAFVSQESGGDEIYVVDRNTKVEKRLTNNTWEWDKHPTYSPDGTQIVFWSNRDTQRKQLWIMNADGSNPRNLSQNEFNDWDPVWIK
jgi:TolB protein